ncbi:alcohol dehydrogenase [bacterium]|nr:MAG: alcohol dehydrogenase [bacterium]
MRAMVLESFGAPLQLRELPDPEPGPGDAVVRVQACGVCASDLKIVSGALTGTPLPHVPGHEIAGVVSAVGSGVSSPRVGERVACYFYLSCNRCLNCRTGRGTVCLALAGRIGFEVDGGLGELVRVPAALCLPVSDGVPPEAAAVAMDAIATPYHAIVTRGRLAPGETAAIVGVGGLGLHAVELAHAVGARVIAIDVDEGRLTLARELGADQTVRIDSAGCLPHAPLVDFVLDTAVSAQTLLGDVALLRPGGRLALVGYKPGLGACWDTADLVLNEITVLPSRAAGLDECRRVLDLLAMGRIRAVVDRRYALQDVNQAFDALRGGMLNGRAVVAL